MALNLSVKGDALVVLTLKKKEKKKYSLSFLNSRAAFCQKEFQITAKGSHLVEDVIQKHLLDVL